MSRATIHSAIAAVVDGVAGIGTVYHGPKNYVDPGTFLSNMGSGVNVCFLWRTATANETAETMPGVVPLRTNIWRYHAFTMEFWYGYDSDSEDTFQSLVDDILTAFNNQRSLGGFQATTPFYLQEVILDTLGAVVCHKATFSVTVIEQVTGLSPA